MVRHGLVALALAVVLAACTSTGTDTEPTAAATSGAPVSSPPSATATPSAAATEVRDTSGVVVLDGGDEPRADLVATTSLDDRIAVTATSASTMDLGGEVDTTTSAADYRLDVVVEPDDGTRLLVATTTDLTTDAVPDVPTTLGRFEWTLTPSGQVMGMAATGWAEPIAPELRTVLSFSHLVLEVPTIPVGTGARWQREADGAEVIVTLHELGDAELRATVEVRSSPPGGELAVTSTGTWERDTLVALDVTTTSEATATREVVAEGEPTTVRVEQVDERHLVREASS